MFSSVIVTRTHPVLFLVRNLALDLALDRCMHMYTSSLLKELAVAVMEGACADEHGEYISLPQMRTLVMGNFFILVFSLESIAIFFSNFF